MPDMYNQTEVLSLVFIFYWPFPAYCTGQISSFKDKVIIKPLSLLNSHGTYIQLPHKDSVPWSSHNRP